MIRKHIIITEAMLARMQKAKLQDGIPLSELVRRALEAELRRRKL